MLLLSEFLETAGELHYKHFTPSELAASLLAKFFCAAPDGEINVMITPALIAASGNLGAKFANSN
ncbi:hypothetical protein DCC62_28790 [candidate division KSB1 bacterium]|nr:MAG: hypothetical protein DCC62_28790 [candidate division KSB1 bacterium]